MKQGPLESCFGFFLACSTSAANCVKIWSCRPWNCQSARLERHEERTCSRLAGLPQSVLLGIPVNPHMFCQVSALSRTLSQCPPCPAALLVHGYSLDMLPFLLCLADLSLQHAMPLLRHHGLACFFALYSSTTNVTGSCSLLPVLYSPIKQKLLGTPSHLLRVGVYVDRPAGTVSFFRVSPGVGGSSNTLTHIHTFQTTFTQEDLIPGFWLYYGSVHLLANRVRMKETQVCEWWRC
ncbi:hypothetical protein N1851_016938 [Merluccius polli]|uniref:Uncharacterized protein n=1 Tax=Merluccius polli TaxID=89951 RepID=A0AA47P1R4_MERPO|nr:hypothetical protein N1851_016938 [Merluccius polli]